jgi:hypothetical protein
MLWVYKIAGILILGISGLQLESPRRKWHLGVGLVARYKKYYKVERWWLPPSSGCGESCESVLLVAHPCTKMLQLRINQLVIWFVQVHVSNWLACHSSQSLSQSFSMPFYPRNVANQGAYSNSSFFHCVHLGFTFESIKELGSASTTFCQSTRSCMQGCQMMFWSSINVIWDCNKP